MTAHEGQPLCGDRPDVQSVSAIVRKERIVTLTAEIVLGCAIVVCFALGWIVGQQR